MTTADMADKPHHGSNVRRFRELMDMKQEGLAIEMGGDWTQRKVSLLEQKETIDPEILTEVAKALKIPAKALETFTETAAVSYFNTFNDSSTNQGNIGEHSTYNFNPIEKWIEALNKNEELYSALLKEKDEKNALLERLLKKL